MGPEHAGTLVNALYHHLMVGFEGVSGLIYHIPLLLLLLLNILCNIIWIYIVHFIEDTRFLHIDNRILCPLFLIVMGTYQPLVVHG